MITMKLLVYLSIGTIAMLVPIAVQTRWYAIRSWKSIPLAVCLTVVGTVGTYILFFVENGWIGGTSFYGAVFFVPVIFLPIARLMREKASDLLDICAPAECVMLMIMKIQCTISGCCGGREIVLLGSQVTVQFPSQIAELLNAIILFCILFLLSRKERNRGSIYPWYMLTYGCTRFILNIFRESWITTNMLLPYGNIWSLVAIVVGSVWLYALWRTKESTGKKAGLCE